LKICYTTRLGGDSLDKPALVDLKDKIDAAGSIRYFSLRHEFSVEEAAYGTALMVAVVAAPGDLQFIEKGIHPP
jgi:hypothetical protein